MQLYTKSDKWKKSTGFPPPSNYPYLGLKIYHIASGINIQWCVSHTQPNFIMFIIVLGQHVLILTESSSGPSKKMDPYLKCLKMHCGIPNAYILDRAFGIPRRIFKHFK